MDNDINNKKLSERSLAAIYNDTQREFQNGRQQRSGSVNIGEHLYVAAPRNRSVEVMAKTRTDDEQYHTRIVFDNIEYVDEETGETHRFTASDGQDYIILPATYNDTDVKVDCGCLDFRYLFAVWHKRDGSLHGNPPPPYIKKTDRKPVNPNKVAGLCKHLIKLKDRLVQDNFLK